MYLLTLWSNSFNIQKEKWSESFKKVFNIYQNKNCCYGIWIMMQEKKSEIEEKGNWHSNHEIPFRKMELSKLNKDTTTTKIKKY